MDEKSMKHAMDFAALRMIEIAIDTLLLHITFKKDPTECLKIFVRIKQSIAESMEERRRDALDEDIQEVLNKIFRDYEEKQKRKDPE